MGNAQTVLALLQKLQQFGRYNITFNTEIIQNNLAIARLFQYPITVLLQSASHSWQEA